MKNAPIKILVLVALIGLTMSTQANATGGRLNASGCHNSKKEGYHCHRTQPVKKATTTPKK